MAKQTTSKYRNRNNLRPFAGANNTEKSLTIQGDSISIYDLFTRYASGQPLPMARQTIDLPEINEVLEDRFDLPDLEKYQNLDMVDQINVKENIRQLKQHILSELERKEAELITAETPPPAQPVEGDTTPPAE